MRVIKARRRGHRAGRKLSKKEKREVKMIISKSLEVKAYTLDTPVTAITSTPGFYDITGGIGVGNNYNQRVGGNIKLKSLKITYDMDAVSGALADNFNHLRVIVFRWYPDSITPPSQGAASTAIWDLASGASYVIAQFDWENRDKYHIIYDSMHTLAPIWAFTNAGALTANQSKQATFATRKPLKFSGKKLGRLSVNYTEGLTTGTGHVFVGVVSDSANLPHPECRFVTQVTYTDA